MSLSFDVLKNTIKGENRSGVTRKNFLKMPCHARDACKLQSKLLQAHGRLSFVCTHDRFFLNNSRIILAKACEFLNIELFIFHTTKNIFFSNFVIHNLSEHSVYIIYDLQI